jgi:hypothetical protein
MDATRFDAMTRTLSSRRTVLTGVVGGGLAALLSLTTAGDAGAEPKRCPRGKKKCGRRCIPKGQACCTRTEKRCGTKCIAKSKCCKDADCGPRMLCAKGQCVIGQGTCAAGANACAGAGACGAAGSGCQCFNTKNPSATRCGDNVRLGGGCSTCNSDADCAAEYPEVRGVFCANGGGIYCSCATSGFCMAPCGLAVLEPK